MCYKNKIMKKKKKRNTRTNLHMVTNSKIYKVSVFTSIIYYKIQTYIFLTKPFLWLQWHQWHHCGVFNPTSQGGTIWSTLVNFCQYLLIGLFNPPDFFWLFLTFVWDQFGNSSNFLNCSHWALYFLFPSTDTKSQLVDRTII